MATTKYDVIVVGSGASGGWAAKELSESGLQVLILDCGRPQKDANFTEHLSPFDLKYRNLRFREPVSGLIKKTRPIQGQCYACTEYNYEWFANDHDEPYTIADNKAYNYFGRMRVVGGRTNVWGPPVLPPERSQLQSRVPRWLRRGLAHQL